MLKYSFQFIKNNKATVESFELLRVQEIFISLNLADRPWALISFLFNGYPGVNPQC
jgi:hypothetical protein